jgi:hypothetical protein
LKINNGVIIESKPIDVNPGAAASAILVEQDLGEQRKG